MSEPGGGRDEGPSARPATARLGGPGTAPLAAAGTVGIRYVGHATVLIELPGIRILTDPFLRGRLGPLRRHGQPPDMAAIGPIDVVLVSHAHPDHFDRRSLEMLEGDPIVIVPRGLETLVGRAGRRAVGTAVGEPIAIGAGRTIWAVAARHWRWPGAPRAATLGYLVESSPEADRHAPGIYFAGDTAPYPAMRDFAERVDLALLPVGSWGPHRSPGHLSPRTAARVAHELAARIAVPIHWGTLYPPALARVAGHRLTEPGRDFAAWAARLAPDVEVRVLRPGESATFPAAPPAPATPAVPAGIRPGSTAEPSTSAPPDR